MFFNDKNVNDLEDRNECLCEECCAKLLIQELLIKETHNHAEQEEIIIDILRRIATEKNKPIKKIEKLLFFKKDKKVAKRFWEILAKKLPEHKYTDIGYCSCGCLEFKEKDHNENSNQPEILINS